jgi:hypothetical protein
MPDTSFYRLALSGHHLPPHGGPDNLTRGLAEAKPIRQTYPSGGLLEVETSFGGARRIGEDMPLRAIESPREAPSSTFPTSRDPAATVFDKLPLEQATSGSRFLRARRLGPSRTQRSGPRA